MSEERPPCPKCHAPYHLEGAERYWEARWRDEKAENERLRKALQYVLDDDGLLPRATSQCRDVIRTTLEEKE